MEAVDVSRRKEAVTELISRFEREKLAGHIEVHFNASGCISKMFHRIADF